MRARVNGRPPIDEVPASAGVLRLLRRLRPGRKVERVATGFRFTEGPVWIREEGCLLFSDIPADRILKLTRGRGVETFREPSGSSNGLTRDLEGRLLACEHGGRRLTRTERDGTITVCAATVGGKRLNSPNDVVVRSDGSIWFTDPPYGIEPEEQELPVRGVYRLERAGAEPTLVAGDFEKPNGLAFSPDETTLYVDDSARRHVRAFGVAADGTLDAGRILLGMDVRERGSPDGMKVDVGGILYCAGPGGVWVIHPDGRHLETIGVPEKPSNCAWGDEDWRSLYVTAQTSVYRIRLDRPGMPVPTPVGG